MNRLLDYLPEVLREIDDFKALTDAEVPELDALSDAIQNYMDDQFVMTASVNGIRRREKILKIQADPSTEPLEFRRRRIINRQSTKPPFTIRWLQEQLDRLIGPGMAVVSVDVQQFILYVTTNIENANLFKEVQYTVRSVKPANLVYQQNTSLNHRIGIEHTTKKRNVAWNYKLDGSWKLGEKPFATLGPEVTL
ncbi:YmfQ family protein [Paenibacillus polysaccharolyticus]|uniref:putative phage tail protein n=1 Tax=Paenibacillus polysaccharolyticus TaxID=582692 RepID=UPI00203FF88C|nr:putative phage tail protein [Paenibacillus polysaccharolyticus]MCM3131911.1 YmfQ family protein [Paenibacillus polysaccharolyticus]